MDTPITVSSSLSSIKKQKKIVAPYSSSSVSHVPVSWDNSPKLYGRESSCTPTSLQKVNSWINSLNVLKSNNSETRTSNKKHSDFSVFDNGLDMEGDFAQTIVHSDLSKSELKEDKLLEGRICLYDSHCDMVESLVERYPNHKFIVTGDYNMPDALWINPSLLVDCLPDSPAVTVFGSFSYLNLNQINNIPNQHNELNQYCSVTYGSFDEAEGTRSSPKIRSGIPHDRSTRKHLHPKAIKRRNLAHVTNLVDGVSKSDESDSDVPLSPESEKKKELCSYLQLMKPTDKKTVMILQNRRSVRVKNLNIMQEKRELEKKLREDQSVDTFVNDVIGHSCQERNVELDEKRHRWLKYRGVRNSVADAFQFPVPTDNLTTVIDFDEVMEEDWLKNWRKRRTLFDINITTSISSEQENELSVENEKMNNTQEKSRLGLKRACVVHQENLKNDKKLKSSKNEDKLFSEKVNEQKKTAQSKSKDFENLDILNLTNNKGDKASFIEKSQGAILKQAEFISLGFSMPKPSLYLATDICDFGDAIRDCTDFIKSDSLWCKKVDAESKTKVSPLKKGNKMSPLLLGNGNTDLQDSVGSNISLVTDSVTVRRRYAGGESKISSAGFAMNDSPKFEKAFNESGQAYSSDAINSQLKKNNRTSSVHLGNNNIDFKDTGQVDKFPNKNNSMSNKKAGGNKLSNMLETINKPNSIRGKNMDSESEKTCSIGYKKNSPKKNNKLSPSCLGKEIICSRVTNPGNQSGGEFSTVGRQNVGVESKSASVKPKSSSTEKKNKVKKSLLFLRRSSSFKIKFVTRKKNSLPCSKGNKHLVSNNSELSSEDSSNPIKIVEGPRVKAITGKKQNRIRNKQKIKNNRKSSVKNGNITEVLPKSLHKHIEENLLQHREATQSSVTEIGEQLFDPPSQEPALPTELPKTENHVNSLSDFHLVRKTHEMGSSSDQNVEKRETSPPTEIMAVFKNHSNGITDIGSKLLSMDPVVADVNAGFHCQILNVEKGSEENACLINKNMANPSLLDFDTLPSSKGDEIKSPISTDHLAKSVIVKKKRSKSFSVRAELPSVGGINSNSTPFISFKKDSGVKPLHRCLNSSKQKGTTINSEEPGSPSNWTGSPITKQKKNQHAIHISKEHGPVLNIFYMEYNLILCQESVVSLWTQTALGNVLGAQNMWIKKGSIQRLLMDNNCTFKESLEMITSTDINVAYVELWTKEHQSDKREGPVADVFATVYFWKKGFSGLEKKVLQLENINGFADDVQYSVIKSSPKIVMSWHLASNELESKKTFIHCYELATDFQSLGNISEFEAVEHYVSSLHNIEGCDTLIMGCGENKITLWNIERGYVAATIEMLDIKSPLSTLWVKCDRGFLFTLQQCVDRELRLIAIHGMNHSWKKLASYVPPKNYDRLRGVCVENGIVLAFYDQGIICWNAQTAETVLETPQTEAEYISGKYIISIVNDQLNLKHAVTHLLLAEES